MKRCHDLPLSPQSLDEKNSLRAESEGVDQTTDLLGKRQPRRYMLYAHTSGWGYK